MRLLHALAISAVVAWSVSPAVAIEVVPGGIRGAEVTVGSVEDGVAEWRAPICECDEGGILMLPVGGDETIDVDVAYFRNAPVTTLDGVSVGTIAAVREVADEVYILVAIDRSLTELVTMIALRAESARALDRGLEIQTEADDLVASIAAVVRQM